MTWSIIQTRVQLCQRCLCIWGQAELIQPQLPIANYTGVPGILVQPISADSAKTLLALLDGKPVREEWAGDLVPTYYMGGKFLSQENVSAIKMTVNNFITDEASNSFHASLPSKDASTVIHIGSRYETKGDQLTHSGLGLACLLALADSLAATYPNGTYRQIMFSTFEAREGDFATGNEFAQMYSSWLETSAIAYLDMDDVLKSGGFLEANVSPLMRQTVREAFDVIRWAGSDNATVSQALHSHTILSVFANIAFKDLPYKLTDGFMFQNPFECDEAVNFHSFHGIPTIQLTAVSPLENATYNLKNTQYDTIEAILKIEDPSLINTHMITSLMGSIALILSSYPLPPVRFEDVGHDIRAGWTELGENKKFHNILKNKRFHGIISAIDEEVTKLVLTFKHEADWYKQGEELMKDSGNLQLNHLKLNERVMKILQLPRRLLRPRGVPSSTVYGRHLIYGSDPVTVCDGLYFPELYWALNQFDEEGNEDHFYALHREFEYLYTTFYALNSDINLSNLIDS